VSGARPVAATNCLNFGNPEKPHIMWQFSEVIDGITEACEKLETPITGGNVSFYNETLGEGIYPTPVMGIVGIVEDTARVMQPNFKDADRAIVLLGGAKAAMTAEIAQAEFGSSEYANEILGAMWGVAPALDLATESALHKALAELAQEQLAESAKDCTDGGLAVALAESGFRHNVGCKVNLSSKGLVAELVLFAENASRALLSCDSKNLERIKQIAIKYNLNAIQVGTTVPEYFTVTVDGKPALAAAVFELREPWQSSLERALHTETEERLIPGVLQRS
jgi:phosphoribosylformylglycinamidine synthase subunit PurL